MWSEILEYIKNNKIRSILTAFGIWWGMFILTILIGLGKGFESGTFSVFNGFNRNTISIYSGTTSIAFQNTPKGTFIEFNEQDIEAIKKSIPEIEYISPELQPNSNVLVTNGDKTIKIQPKGVFEDYFKIKFLTILSGRLFNRHDFAQKKRVTLIGKAIAEVLFVKVENAIGKNIFISGQKFTIIGVIDKSIFSQFDSREIFISNFSFSELFNFNISFYNFLLAPKDNKNFKQLEEHIRNILARKHSFNQYDKKALYISSMDEQVQTFKKLFDGIEYFLWFVGISTLLSGLVGVCNIMYVNVNERQKEIGIRKALGAKSSSIRRMIITESVLFTSLAGLFGLSIGALLLQSLNMYLSDKDYILKETYIDYNTIAISLIILIITGALSGFLPAQKASNLQIIDTLKDE